jgi:hypothetical protein
MSTKGTSGARTKAAGPQDHKRPRSKTAPTTTPTTEEKVGWWSRFTAWCKRTWNRFTAWVRSLATKFANAFRVKERDEQGRITNQSWFGKWILNPTMKFMGWIGKALLWITQFILVVLTVAVAIIFTLIVALAIVIALAVYALALIIYRVILGIALILVTPYRAYQDREASDRDWESYWKSWNPKFWIVMDLDDIPIMEDLYEDIKAQYFNVKDGIFNEDSPGWSQNGFFNAEEAFA